MDSGTCDGTLEDGIFERDALGRDALGEMLCKSYQGSDSPMSGG